LRSALANGSFIDCSYSSASMPQKLTAMDDRPLAMSCSIRGSVAAVAFVIRCTEKPRCAMCSMNSGARGWISGSPPPARVTLRAIQDVLEPPASATSYSERMRSSVRCVICPNKGMSSRGQPTQAALQRFVSSSSISVVTSSSERSKGVIWRAVDRVVLLVACRSSGCGSGLQAMLQEKRVAPNHLGVARRPAEQANLPKARALEACGDAVVVCRNTGPKPLDSRTDADRQHPLLGLRDAAESFAC
jgi:hypothetical protein